MGIKHTSKVLEAYQHSIPDDHHMWDCKMRQGEQLPLMVVQILS